MQTSSHSKRPRKSAYGAAKLDTVPRQDHGASTVPSYHYECRGCKKVEAHTRPGPYTCNRCNRRMEQVGADRVKHLVCPHCATRWPYVTDANRSALRAAGCSRCGKRFSKE